MGRVYTIIGIFYTHIYGRVFAYYVRFLLYDMSVNFFQVVLLFVFSAFIALYLMFATTNVIVTKDLYGGRAWETGVATWKEGEGTDSFLKSIFIYSILTIIFCLIAHLITWTALSKISQFRLSDSLREICALWHKKRSPYLELPVYLAYAYRLFFRPYESHYDYSKDPRFL